MLVKYIILTVVLFSLTTSNNFAQMHYLKLSQPKLNEGKKLRQDILERHSNRSFDNKKSISLEQLSTILWAAYGKKIENVDSVTSASYTIPSAGAIYALEIFVLVGKGAVENIPEGLYYYLKDEHSLKPISNVDNRKELSIACLEQEFIEIAPLTIVIAAQFDSMTQRYRDRAEKYVYYEAGHAAQNIYLIVNDLGLTTVEVGAFKDDEVAKALRIDYPVLLIMPIGYKK